MRRMHKVVGFHRRLFFEVSSVFGLFCGYLVNLLLNAPPHAETLLSFSLSFLQRCLCSYFSHRLQRAEQSSFSLQPRRSEEHEVQTNLRQCATAGGKGQDSQTSAGEGNHLVVCSERTGSGLPLLNMTRGNKLWCKKRGKRLTYLNVWRDPATDTGRD